MPGVERNPIAATLDQAAAELSAERSRGQVLERMVQLAPDVIPAAEQVSVTVEGEAGLVTAAASGALAEQIDAIQFEVGEGPCVAALRAGEMVLVPDLAAEKRWPGFTSRVAQQERVRVWSMLSLPLRTGGEVAGSLNLASAASHAFPAPSRAAGVVFAAVAALALAAAAERERAAERVAQAEAFAAALGYDLRSGVGAALAAADVVRRRRVHLDRRGQEALDLLTDELVRQQRLLVALLDMARKAGDRLRCPVALLPVVQEALRRHSQPVDLQVQPGSAEALVAIHPVLLSRIVASLLDNADRHAGGATGVQVGRAGNRAWVAVEDAGPGVPAGQREYIFTRFRTASTAPPMRGRV